MKEIITINTTIGFILAFFSYAIGGYINIWIYYPADKKNPLFPILHPFSFSLNELMLNSILKLNWKLEDKLENLNENQIN